MKKIWVNKARSFKEAEEFDIDYYFGMSRAERLADMQYIREIYFNKILPHLKHKKDLYKELNNGKGRKRLRRVITII